MSAPDGGPAFPWLGREHNYSGMTLRDYFAAAAMQGLLADHTFDGPWSRSAEGCYAAADAMLAERAK